MKFKAKVEENKIQFPEKIKKRLNKQLEIWNEKWIVIDIRLKKELRSTEQNNYYWKLLEILSNEIGEDQSSLHEYFKQKFLSKELNVMGENIKVTLSTMILKTDEFVKYVQEIRHFSLHELEIYLPEPDEI